MERKKEMEAKKLLTVEEFVRDHEDSRCEMVDGVVQEKQIATLEHSSVQIALGEALHSLFHKRTGGPGRPGGWWILTEAAVRYPPKTVFLHDLAGWRRSRVPERPKGIPAHDRPDWVCEILSSNRKNDFVRKKAILQEHEIPYYWIADPEENTLLIFEWSDKGYVNTLSVDSTFTGKLPPFDAVELSVSQLFGLDDD